MYKYVTADEAVSVIASGNRVFIHSVAAAPRLLIEAMVRRAPELRNVEIVHLHTEGDAPYAKPEYAENFRVNAFFVGANVRKALAEGRADYVPIFLSEVPALFRRNILPLDVALVQVSPPDKHGFCSLGVSVDVSRAAVQKARYVIAQVNENMPRTHGDALIHADVFHAMIESDDELHLFENPPANEIELQIGHNVASLIEDGATLQMGIGAIPDAVLGCLGNHKRLGIHTEMFSNGLIDLVEKGVVTGEDKRVHPGKIVGQRRLVKEADRAVGGQLDQGQVLFALQPLVGAGVRAGPLARGGVEVLRNRAPGHVQHVPDLRLHLFVPDHGLNARQVLDGYDRIGRAVVFGKRAVGQGKGMELGKAALSIVQNLIPAKGLSGAKGHKAAHDGDVGIARMHVAAEDGQAGVANGGPDPLQHVRGQAAAVEAVDHEQLLAAEIRPVPVRRGHLGKRLLIKPGPDAVRGIGRIRILQRKRAVQHVQRAQTPGLLLAVEQGQGILKGRARGMDRAALERRVVSGRGKGRGNGPNRGVIVRVELRQRGVKCRPPAFGNLHGLAPPCCFCLPVWPCGLQNSMD